MINFEICMLIPKKLFICISLLSLALLFSCKAKEGVIKDGKKAYQYKKYVLASTLLTADYAKSNDPVVQYDLAMKIGDSYRMRNSNENAEIWYKKAFELKADPNAGMMYGKMLKVNGKYTDAMTLFQKIYKDHKLSEANLQREGCKDAIDWMSAAPYIKVENLREINSKAADFSLTPFGPNNFVFSSSRGDAKGDKFNEWTGEKNADLMLIKNFSAPVSLSDTLNSEAYEGTCVFNNSLKEIYFTRCSQSKNTNSYCRLYSSIFEEDEWSSPELIPLFGDTVNVGHPALSKDGRKLFFVSDAPGSFGGKDIYYVVKKGMGWSEPINAGRHVNTKGNEMFPTIGVNDVLYFSSDYHKGMGGLDIFKAELTENSRMYTNVTNLQYPINSSHDDFGLIKTKTKPKDADDFVKEQGYFTSNRKDGMGSDDLYKYTIEHINTYELIVKVIEKTYDSTDILFLNPTGVKPLPNARIELTNLTRKEFKKNGITNEYGNYNHILSAGTDYEIKALSPLGSGNRAKYLSKTTTTSTKGLKSNDSMLIQIYVTIELEKIIPDKEIVINNIYYDLDKSNLRPESLPTLDSLVGFFKENNTLTIELGSHTDSRATNEYNQTLSQARAQSAVDYLISKGVPTSKIIAKGYGETKLINKCVDGIECSEEEHQKNRRTTFKIVGVGIEVESGD